MTRSRTIPVLFRAPAHAPLVLPTLLALSLAAADVSSLRVSQLSAADKDDQKVAATDVDYLREVKPILQKRCYACHGALKQTHSLRLDTAAAIRKGGEAGPAVLAGKPDESLLIQVVTGAAGFKMPPAADGAPLTDDEIKLLRRWIASGANAPADEQPQEDPRAFWSYQAPQSRPTPLVSGATWVRGPIDAWIAAAQQSRGLVAGPDAPPAVWLRRIYLDLIGLGPDREELHEFLADGAPDSRQRVIDRLLARPEYGERWGRHWMDVWRYSDWYGSRGINEIRYSQRHIWRWRDWIVESLNQDKPYSEMVVEMLAGDELAPTDPNVLRATGFLGRNWYKFDRNVWMFETIEQTSQAFLAATLRCCRCHDHKFDPLMQEDYYRFRAFFEPHDVRTDRLAADVATEKDATLGEVPKDGVARVFDKRLDAPTYLFQRGDSRYPDEKKPLTPGVPASFGLPDPSVQVVNLPPEAYYPLLKPEYRAGLVAQAAAVVTKAEQAVVEARGRATDAQRRADELAAKVAAGDAAAANPAPVLNEDFAKPKPDQWEITRGEWKFDAGKLTLNQPTSFATIVSKTKNPANFRAKVEYTPLQPGALRSIGFSYDYIDAGNSQDIYTSTGDAQQTVQAFHRLNGQQVYPPAGIVKTMLKVGQRATIEISVRANQLTIWLNGEKKLDYILPTPRREGRFALWAHDAAVEFHSVEIRELVASLDDLQREQRTAQGQVALSERKVATARAELAALNARIAAEIAKYGGRPAEEVSAAAKAAARAEREVGVAKQLEAVLQAEQYLMEVQAGGMGPAEAEKKLADARDALSKAIALRDTPDEKYAPLGEQLPQTSTGRRLALARWMIDPKNPRTARVAVNHIWLRHFGQAIVPSVANFGLNGDRPSHLELLDMLALRLTDSGWQMKALHRDLVASATYGRSSAELPDAHPNLKIDRDNRYLWRANSRRMEAEQVRDVVLHVAGGLDLRRGGPEIPESEGQTSPRRSVYFRNTPNEKMKFLELFDVADPNACYRRRESVVPQQALALMNSGIAVDSARRLADRLWREASSVTKNESDTAVDFNSTDSTAQQRFIVTAFEQVLGHVPSENESAACLKFLDDQTRLASQANSPRFTGAAPAKSTPSPAAAQRARENLVHVLLNHNEFVTIR